MEAAAFFVLISNYRIIKLKKSKFQTGFFAHH